MNVPPAATTADAPAAIDAPQAAAAAAGDSKPARQSRLLGWRDAIANPAKRLRGEPGGADGAPAGDGLAAKAPRAPWVHTPAARPLGLSLTDAVRLDLPFVMERSFPSVPQAAAKIASGEPAGEPDGAGCSHSPAPPPEAQPPGGADALTSSGGDAAPVATAGPEAAPEVRATSYLLSQRIRLFFFSANYKCLFLCSFFFLIARTVPSVQSAALSASTSPTHLYASLAFRHTTSRMQSVPPSEKAQICPRLLQRVLPAPSLPSPRPRCRMLPRRPRRAPRTQLPVRSHGQAQFAAGHIPSPYAPCRHPDCHGPPGLRLQR